MSNVIDLSALRAREKREEAEAAKPQTHAKSAMELLMTPQASVPENKFGAASDTGASAGTELDVAAAMVMLKARARRLGRDAIPLEVRLSPVAPDAGWRRAAERVVAEHAIKRQRGEPIDLR